MDYVEMEETHNSLEELAQPPLSSLRMRGDSSMSHSLCMSKAYGKDIIWLHSDLYDEYVHSLTIHVQDIASRRNILPSRSHGLLEAISNIGDGHSLGGLGEIVYFAGHVHLAPFTIHFLQDSEDIGVASEKPHIMSVSIEIESQAVLVAFEGPFSFSYATYGSQYDSHYGSLCCCCFYFCWEHDWGRDTLVGCVHGGIGFPHFLQYMF